MPRPKNVGNNTPPTFQIDIDCADSIEFELKESVLLENDNKKECIVVGADETNQLHRPDIIQSWRKQNPKCECALNSEKCPAAAATRADIFEAASKGDTKTLSWYFRSFEPEEVL